jgi:uncharacterized membrane protein YqiK
MFEFMAVLGFGAVGFVAAWVLAGVRYIPHRRVGVVERLWSPRGGVVEGHLLALRGEAGFQAEVLRGGVHLGYTSLAYRVHAEPLVTVSEGQLGYVYARDGQMLDLGQTLGRVVPCNHFQDTRAFLEGGGQRGRQRAILREGVYAINLSQFVVLTKDAIYAGPVTRSEHKELLHWQEALQAVDGFSPVVVRSTREQDPIGVVTVQDGPALGAGELIAPEVGEHACFQDPEAFLAVGGHRGKQLQVLTDGTYFVNRWFASVSLEAKTLIPIGYVGVVVSYHGESGEDVTGERFRYGEQVEPGSRGVWKRALPPGKYALNPFAAKVELVPTVNFVLRWVTGQAEAHQYDKDLQSLELITADGFEPCLPLSLVLHIDYEKAPRVVQRFGDVRRLISQTLDPILSAYFRDVAQNCAMLDLLTRREQIQQVATEELGRRFREFDINCVAVMIGRPEVPEHQGQDPIDLLFGQLRERRLAEEQIATFQRQEDAAVQLRALRRVEAEAQKQTELTEAEMNVQIEVQRAEGALETAKRQAKSVVARAVGEAKSTRLRGAAEAEATERVGRAGAEVLRMRTRAVGDGRLVALTEIAGKLATSTQPLVPQRLMSSSGDDSSPLQALIRLTMAEKAGFPMADEPEPLPAPIPDPDEELGDAELVDALR